MCESVTTRNHRYFYITLLMSQYLKIPLLLSLFKMKGVIRPAAFLFLHVLIKQHILLHRTFTSQRFDNRIAI